jgi:hypothetical protein
MNEISAKKQRGRPFKKGVSPNPSGRPKTPAEMKEAFRAHTPEAIDYLGRLVMDETARPADRIRAAEIIIDHGIGKAAQELQITGERNFSISFDPVLREELGVASEAKLAQFYRV